MQQLNSTSIYKTRALESVIMFEFFHREKHLVPLTRRTELGHSNPLTWMVIFFLCGVFLFPPLFSRWVQNLRLKPGPAADAPWFVVVRWKPVSLRSSSPCENQAQVIEQGLCSCIYLSKNLNNNKKPILRWETNVWFSGITVKGWCWVINNL